MALGGGTVWECPKCALFTHRAWDAGITGIPGEADGGPPGDTGTVVHVRAVQEETDTRWRAVWRPVPGGERTTKRGLTEGERTQAAAAASPEAPENPAARGVRLKRDDGSANLSCP